MTELEVAERLGVFYQRVNDWKHGRRRVSVKDAIKIREKTGLSLDYTLIENSKNVLDSIVDILEADDFDKKHI